MKTAGIYIHIPFCAIKCMYCDFYSVADREDAIPKFVKSIIWEIENCSIDVSEWEFDTIFFGGGTPSLLEAKYLDSIFSSLSKKYDISNIKEFTIEANPGEAPTSLAVLLILSPLFKCLKIFIFLGSKSCFAYKSNGKSTHRTRN